MPMVIMILSSLVILLAYVLPIKWILQTEAASTNEKMIFILLTLVVAIFSYYLFYAYMNYSRKI